jgi:hypothetical protein
LPPKLYPALLGGLFIGVVSALPILKPANGCCCLWMGVGGVLAAYVMQQNHPRQVSLGDGAAVGLLAGVAGFFVMLLAAVPISFVGDYGPAYSRGVFATPEGVNPEVRDLIRSIPPSVLAVVSGAMFLGLGSVVSLVGGLVGAAWFRRSVPSPPPAGPAPPGWIAPADSEPPPLPDLGAPPLEGAPAAGPAEAVADESATPESGTPEGGAADPGPPAGSGQRSSEPS